MKYPQKPYFIRAVYQWIIDNEWTPYLLVDADTEAKGLLIPTDYVEDGEIVLDISPMAVRDFDINNSRIFFSAKFNEVAMDIVVPMKSVMAVYANENDQGMAFSIEEDTFDYDGADDDGSSDSGAKSGVPHLRIVK